MGVNMYFGIITTEEEEKTKVDITLPRSAKTTHRHVSHCFIIYINMPFYAVKSFKGLLNYILIIK